MTEAEPALATLQLVKECGGLLHSGAWDVIEQVLDHAVAASGVGLDDGAELTQHLPQKKKGTTS